MSDCYLCRKPLHGDSSSVDIKRWDPRRNVFFVDILPRMNAGDSRISRFGFLFATTRQEGRGR